MAALTAVPLSSGRVEVAHGGDACGGDVAGPRGESITPCGGDPKRREGTREEPRRGWHSRERERHFRARRDAEVQSGSGLARERMPMKHESGAGDDDRPAGSAGKTPGRLKTRRASGPCVALNRRHRGAASRREQRLEGSPLTRSRGLANLADGGSRMRAASVRSAGRAMPGRLGARKRAMDRREESRP
jgi:hypothetical protein